MNDPFVLLPGLGFDGKVWDNFKVAVGSDIDCSVFNLPGHQMPVGVGTLSLREWFDEWALHLPEKAHYLGWSLGGLVALKLAQWYPDRVSSVATLATSPCFLQNDAWAGVSHADWEPFMSTQSSDGMAKRLLAMQGPRSVCRELKPMQLAPPYLGWKMGLSALAQWDMRSFLSSCDTPICCLFGANDALLHPDTFTLVRDAYPHHRAHLIDSAPHALLHTHSVECYTRLKEFWNVA